MCNNYRKFLFGGVAIMSGPSPKPTALRLLEGTAKTGARINHGEPMPAGPLPPAPDTLGPEELELWAHMVAAAPAKLLTACDWATVELYVCAWALHRKAAADVRARGSVIYTADNNLIQNPYLAVMNRQAQIMLKAGDTLGMSPASRTRINLDQSTPAGKGKKPKGPEEFFP
jgi:P27 family predicted phage terminase small subunit